MVPISISYTLSLTKLKQFRSKIETTQIYPNETTKFLVTGPNEINPPGPIQERPARKSWLSARTTLWYMSFCGFAINYVLRNNLNIAIVGMIKTGNIGANKSTAHSTTGSECYNNTVLLYTTNLTDHEHLNHSDVADENLLKTSGYLFERLFLDLINVSAI